MCDEYDNDNYAPDYYDKEIRDAYPDVYGYDEYAQQFTPPVRKTVKRRNVVAGKSNKVTKGVGAERLRKKAEAKKNDTIYMIVYLVMLAVFLFMCLFFIVWG